MIRNYFIIGWRNLFKNKAYSAINIGGLALGMSVAMLVGLWVYDELTFNSTFENHEKIVMITKSSEVEGRRFEGNRFLPWPLINELRTNYASNFEHIIPVSGRWEGVLAASDKSLLKTGMYIGEEAPSMLTLEMIRGDWNAMTDPYTIIISESTSKALFDDEDPLDKTITINSRTEVKVTGVFKDLPANTDFYGIHFFEPWAFYEIDLPWLTTQGWENHIINMYAQVAADRSFEEVSVNIRDAELNATALDHMQDRVKSKTEINMIPMKDWHLRSTYKKGELQTSPVQLVWFIGMIGVFTLLLACINFMNLSTARSERRAKEVGVRKTMGSMRSQLVSQFFAESFFVVGCAFVLAMIVSVLVLPVFNQLSGKLLSMPWAQPWFWMSSSLFVFITGLLAGSYPALYLSSFKPVSVLKGTFAGGRFTSMPRKILVVTQFTVSITLIICTAAIYHQLAFIKERPVGYDREGLLMIRKRSDSHFEKAQSIMTELKNSGAVVSIAESGGPVTGIWSMNGGFVWEGKPADMQDQFATLNVSRTYGKTVGWQFVDGRDFSEDIASDSFGVVLNESAVKYMNLKGPVGKTITSINRNWSEEMGARLTIIGVIRDMVMRSPFDAVDPTIYLSSRGPDKYFIARINPSLPASEALPKISAVFERITPDMPFDFKFVDDDYAMKFSTEDRIGKLAAVFTILAIVISCLGLSGLASFVTERRTKEIGIRKVLGASILNLWAKLSGEFVMLVAAACFVSMPVAWYILSAGFESYKYKTGIDWWIFVAAGGGAIAIAVLTVSYQAVRSALMNPVKSLRSE